jgi:hypothetical protein
MNTPSCDSLEWKFKRAVYLVHETNQIPNLLWAQHGELRGVDRPITNCRRPADLDGAIGSNIVVCVDVLGLGIGEIAVLLGC